jgi:hypothetical protein
MENQYNTTEKEVLDKIKSGEIKMTSRWYFGMQTVLLCIGGLVLFFFIVYLLSFIIFSLRATGLLFLPKFGFTGLRLLVGPFPWLLVLLIAALIIILELFAHQFYFIYHQPVTYSLFGIIAIVIITALVIGNTPFHAILFRSAQDRQLPIVGGFYRMYGAPMIHDVHHGIVSGINDQGLLIETPNSEELTILIAPDQIVDNHIQEGDTIVVIGERIENIVRAWAIRKISEDTLIFPVRPHQMMR